MTSAPYKPGPSTITYAHSTARVQMKPLVGARIVQKHHAVSSVMTGECVRCLLAGRVNRIVDHPFDFLALLVQEAVVDLHLHDRDEVRHRQENFVTISAD